MLLSALFPRCSCLFSKKFAQGKTQICLRVKTDDKASLCEKYSADVVPTVPFFENEKAARRLGGTPGVGLREKQLTDFVSKC
jgi:hypothetical protein